MRESKREFTRLERGSAGRTSRGRRGESRVALALVLTLLLGVASSRAEASRFRYGTLSWAPTSTIDTANDLQTVEFTIRASFRRDYQWGAYYNEQWAQTSASSGTKTFYGSEGALREGSAGFDSTLAGCTDEALSSVFTQNACFDCPAGSTAGFFGCEYTDPQVDYLATDSSGNGVSGERFFLRFPPKKQNDGTTDVVPCPTPFHCDARKAETSPVFPRSTTFTNQENVVASALCDDFGNNPDKDAAKCAPWSELYGMFMGDGSSKTVELEVTDVTEDDGGRLGNSLTGVGTFTHAYKRNTDDPFVAFFTGGERFYECDYPSSPLSSTGACDGSLNSMLNNNQQGRYRLEVEVWLKGDGNRSPVVHQAPVLPIPHQLPGVRAKFQIAAMDPDGDALTFRLGDKLEMGGVTRSKTEAFPYSQQVGLAAPSRSRYDTSGKLLPNYGTEYGPFECDLDSKEVALTGRCPSDREPEQVSGLSTHSFTSTVPGLMEWNTWTASDGSPCPNAGGEGCSKLRSGFYNMVVMVSDKSDARASGVKVPVDFMTYLYDGPMHYCGESCKKNKAGLLTHADLDGIHGSCSVCGYGEGNMTTSTCQAETADGDCGIAQSVWNSEDQVLETSIVPSPTSACKLNTAPIFATTGLVNGALNNPRLDIYENSVATGSQEKPVITKYAGEDFEFYITAMDTDGCAGSTTPLSVHAVGLPVGAAFSDPEVLSVPEGTMVRRKFTWDAAGGSDARPEKSLACFYATDGYLATAEPYYCIELHLHQKPAAEEETLLRFNCKLALNWQPDLKRFVLVEGGSRYYTAMSFDDYMWHHSMVSIDDEGYGQLYVDGVAQDLEIHVGTDSSDTASYGKGTAIGNFFYTTEYANKCDGTTGGTLDPADGSCCSFRMGTACDDGTTATFDGIVDEVAVWNRGLDSDEVASTLFHMPKSLSSRRLEAPRGNQVDFSAWRTLYARFNNPCTEGPSTSSKVADEAGRSAGDDLRDDQVTIASDKKYIYTGVPWATPFMTHTTVDDSTLPIDGGITIVSYGVGLAKSPFTKCISAAEDMSVDNSFGKYDYGYKEEGSTIVIADGKEMSNAMVTLATVSHQPNDELPHLVVQSKRHPAQKSYVGQLRSDWHVTTEDNAAPDGGSMRFGNIPPFQQMPDHSWLPGDNLRESFLYGFYEAAICKLPKGLYPSRSYYLGLSNDTGITGSPKHMDMTYSEYSMKTSATASVQLTTEAKGKTFAMWFFAEDIGDATLMLLSNNLAVLWQGGQIKLMDSSTVLTTSANLALNEWHHLAVVIDDSDSVIAYTDGVKGSPAQVASVIGGYSVVNLANGFIGYIDELKVLQEAMVEYKLFDVMFTRYTQPGDVYYRFNTNTGYIATPLQTAVSIVPTSVPWEPVSVDSVKLNGTAPGSVLPVSMTGGEELVVEGFNIAPSKWLKCNFGSYRDFRGYDASEEQDSASNSPGSSVGQGDLNRPDSRPYSAVQYGLNKVDRSIYSTVVSSSITKVNEKSFKCPVPEFDFVRGVVLGFGEISHPDDAINVDVTETSLVCDGSSYAKGFSSSSSIIENNYNGYTISLWAKPSGSPSTSQTLLAFQVSGAKSAMINFDGASGTFSYYDNKILDVSDPPTAENTASGKWHHVAVTVSGEGDGTLFLEGVPSKAFTTTSTPFPDNELTLCGGLNSTGQGENFFSGLVDEVHVFKGVLSARDIKSLAGHAAIANQVVSAQTSAGNGVSSYKSRVTSTFDLGNMEEAKTYSAWNGMTTFDIKPDEVPLQGGVDVVLIGANYDPLATTTDLGEISSMTTNQLTVHASAVSEAQVNPVNVTSGFHSVNYGDHEVEHFPQAVDLVRGLVAHYTMDRRFNEDGTGRSTIFDESGNGNDIHWMPSWTDDRHGNPNGAVMVGPTFTSLAGEMKTDFAKGLTNASICAYMRVNYPAPDASITRVGGFKMYCLTTDSSGSDIVSVNLRSVDETEASALKGPLKSAFSGNLLSGLSAVVDEVWIWDRVLTPYEVMLRYNLDDYAIDLSQTPIHVRNAAAASPMPSIASFELWVKPKSFGLDQTLLKTSSFELDFSSSGSLHLVVDVTDSSCTCTSCLAYEEYTSWKATLQPNKWAHVGISITGKTVLLFVDGVLVDEVTFQALPSDRSLNTYSAMDAEQDLLFTIGSTFDGHLYDVRLSEDFKNAASYRTTTVCPTAAAGNDIYFALNNGNSVEFPSKSDLFIVIPKKSAWTSAVFDDDTQLENTVLYGPGLISATSASPGHFTITSRTACMRKRRTGGDDFEVDFQHKEDGTKTTISALSANDGNYHVSYSGLQCGTHEMAISSNGVVVKTLDVNVAPSETSTSASYVVDLSSIASPNVIGCFGSFARFNIQSMDGYGCKSGTDGSDNWVANITGPDNFVVNGVHTMDGLYQVSFVPPAAGKYVVEVKLGTTTFTSFCIEVCVGSAMYFYGNTAVEFADSGSTFSLEGNTGLTMEAWVKPLSDSGQDSYILLKDSYTQKDEYIKGFDLAITDSLSSISASVYVGAGETRSISAPVPPLTSWTHLSVVYAGAEMNVYVNGELKASKPFSESKPVHVNPYSHPLTVGYGFSGIIDEVKVFSYGKSAGQVLESMYCPSFLEKEKLVAYVGFNKASEGVAPTALTGTKNPGSLTSVGGTGVGPKPVGQVTTSSDIPYASSSGDGVGIVGAAYTTAKLNSTASAGLYLMDVEVRDKCGFRYTGTDLNAVTVEFKTFEERYLKGAPAHLTGNVISGSSYPNTDIVCGSGTGTYLVTGQLSEAGNYSVTVSVSGEVASEHEITVSPAEFAAFEVIQPGLANFVAGVSSSLGIVPTDGHGNSICWLDVSPYDANLMKTELSGWKLRVVNEDDLHAAFKFFGGPSSSCEEGMGLEVFFTEPGNHTIVIEADTVPQPTVHTFQVVVDPAEDWVPVEGQVPSETNRLLHSAFAYKGDMYIFGGATGANEYRSDMYKLGGLSLYSGTSYMRTVVIPPESSTIVLLHLNTLELVGMGRMLPTCMDIHFVHNKELLPYWIDPHSEGCISENTKVYIRIPDGSQGSSINMYYGNAGMHDVHPRTSVSQVFDLSESGARVLNYESYEFAVEEGLTDAPLPVRMTNVQTGSDVFMLQNEASYVTEELIPMPTPLDWFGSTGPRLPGSDSVITIPADKVLESYTLTARMYDPHTPSEASYWISPNYKNATSTFVAAGIHSPSHSEKYCTASPWKASGVTRSQGWHTIEIAGTPDSTTVKIDGAVVRQDDFGSLFTGISMSLGPGVLFDSLVVIPSGSVTPLQSNGAANDLRVSYKPDRSWQAVHTAASPSARVSAVGALVPSSLAHSDSYYLFGGERNGYAFNDLWRYDFTSETFTFVSVSNASPPGRYDHAAIATSDGRLVIIGGRDASGTALKDIWAFDPLAKSWSKVGDIVSPAFGLAAAAVGNDVYVLGGKESGGLSSRFQKCSPHAGGYACEDITGGCPLELGQSVNEVGMSPRYRHSMFAVGGDNLYVYGGHESEVQGSGIIEVELTHQAQGAAGDARVYNFDPASCHWTVAMEDLCKADGDSSPCVKYDGAAGPLEDGAFLHNYDHTGALGVPTVFTVPL